MFDWLRKAIRQETEPVQIAITLATALNIISATTTLVSAVRILKAVDELRRLKGG